MTKRFWDSRFFIFLILVLAVFLRVYNIPQTLLFHFDQGYHGLAIKEIWESKRIALLGHKTDVEGIFHGSFFYYLILPLYLISGWNPTGVSLILAILDGMTVIFIFLLGRELFDRRVGVLAAIFYAVSYPLISYSRWLSNVTPIPFFSTVFFYFLLKSFRQKIEYLPLACLSLGIVAQLNGAIGFFLLLALIVSVLVLRKAIWLRKKVSFSALILFFLPATPLVFFDLRHQFLVTRSILKLFSRGGLGLSLNQLFTHFNFLKNEFENLLSYKSWVVALMLLFLILGAVFSSWRMRKKWEQGKILIFFLSVPLLGLLFYPGGIHQFFFIGTLPLMVLVVAWSLIYWGKKKIFRPVILLFILLIIGLNLYHWRGFLRPGFNLIPIGTRNLITLEDRIKAVDFMYWKSAGTPFKTIIYIIPYFQEQPWDYVFSWYGKSKYGYIPNSQAAKTFVIYEPDYDFPYRLDNWLVRIEKDHGKVIYSFKTHDLTVEEREK